MSDANEAAKADREAYINGLSLDEAHAVGFREGAAHMHKAQADEITRLRAALRKIAEGDIPRPVAKPYRTDGTPSKNDQCKHGQWMYENCGQCIEQFARAALEGK